jgi:hypothetical protein
MRRCAVVLALIVLGGCGGGDHKADTPRHAQPESAAKPDSGAKDRGAEEGGEEQEKGGLADIPVEDRRAFLQIGVASSNLRSGASLVLVKGFARPREKVTLLRLIHGVGRLRPHDPRLRRLRVETLQALGRGFRAQRGGAPSRSAARAVLADADRIQQGLERYSNAKPAIGAIAPE